MCITENAVWKLFLLVSFCLILCFTVCQLSVVQILCMLIYPFRVIGGISEATFQVLLLSLNK